MRIFGFTVSRGEKPGPGPIRIGELELNPSTLVEILEAHTRDIATLNTAVNRIERKQNRWLEVLNLKGDPPENGEKSAVLNYPAAPGKDQPGAEEFL